MNDAHLMGKLCRIRPYRVGDEDAICAVANDFIVARWMSRSFPYPYVRSDAEQWIKLATSDTRRRYFAIEVDGVLAGGIGVEPFGAERNGRIWLLAGPSLLGPRDRNRCRKNSLRSSASNGPLASP